MHNVFLNTNINVNKFKQVVYKKGEIVFNELDPVNSIGFVCYGNISIKTYTYNEKEYEINNISGNSLFGEFMLFSNNPVFLGTGITVKETKVIYLSKKELIECMGNQRFSENYLSLISSISRNIQRKVKVLSQKEIRDKILFILYDNLKQNKNNVYYIESKEKLSRFINVTRPSLSRELINMKNEGIIDFGKHYIKLN